MFAATTLLRRYTPPTCTLELYVHQSPLSRWAGRPVVRDLHFRLHLDDPRLPDEQRVTLQGDRQHLDALHAVVETYVQAHLTQMDWDLEALTSTVLTALAPAADEEMPLEEEASSEAMMAEATPPQDASPPGCLSVSPPVSAPDEAPIVPVPALVRSAPSVLSEQQATTESRSRVERGSMALQCDRRNPLQIEPDGGLYHRLHLGPLATPQVGDTVQLSTLQLFDLATALDAYGEELMALPETLGRAWFKPSTTWARTAAIAIVVIGVATSIVRLAEQPQVAMQAEVPTGSEGASSFDQRREAVAVAPLPTPSFRGIPGSLTPEAVPGAPPPGIPTPPPGSLAQLPPYSPGNSSPPSSPEVATVPIPAAPPPDLAMAPPPPSPLPAPSEMGTITIPAEPSGTADLPEIPASLRNAAPPTAARSGVAADEVATGASQDGQTAASTPGTTSTAFDVIPQVAEVRAYFQGQWQVPEGLSQTLEYSLELNPNGSIQRIFPLGQAAGNYIDRTGMPLIGEPFVSPIADGKQARIRLVLRPDGKVQTFLESMN
ncbi:DUF4335 domain-containing protein [Trichothermofontia sichuanensis B231]|uniref:DUF4335 domain-containing protein n=1 Tax=Trichothermofontia sichuanensis TaxID=3045816 RepID=UPI00224558CF|nr:DUF4335 domain-containing protein [Trichothermofontia sichuanensis]UZQ52954.1 DUF4335 domain-containing protein [Trichothermofontia sichuanensis B231]